MRVMDLVVDVLKAEGVDKMFCYPTTPVIEAAAKAGIRPILCRQERVGVDMANGYTRIRNGRPFGVFAMQYGPGAENAFSGIATAYSDSTPLLLLPLGHRREVAQVRPTFRSSVTYASVTKNVEEIVDVRETPNVMRRALSMLKNGRLGPVMVELPMDLVEQSVDLDLSKYRGVRATRSSGDPRDVDDAVRLLLEAKCPIIQAGQGIFYAEACAELLEFAELVGVPVITTIEGKSAFPENHPLSLGASGAVLTGHGKHFLEKSDLVFAIGSSLTRHHLTNRVFGVTEKKVVHAVNDPFDLYKGYETEVGIVGDAKLVLRQLIDAARERLGKGRVAGQAVAAEVSKVKSAWLSEWEKKRNSDEVPITPYRAMLEFARAVKADDAIITHDSGSPRDQITPFYESTIPHSYLGWGKSHALGTGLGLAIGAKLASPAKFCVNFMGDAAFGMTGLDFETSVRVDAPICTVVFNNSTMAVETDNMALSHQMFRTRDIGGNYASIGRELGGHGIRVTHPSELHEAFLAAKKETENGRAVLLEIVTSEERDFSFRRNSFAALRAAQAKEAGVSP